VIHRLSDPLPIYDQGNTPDCGPYALAMATGSTPDEMLRRLAPYRLPGLGVTPPWGLVRVARELGFRVEWGLRGSLVDLQNAIDRDQPAIVLVHPTDYPSCPWYVLHYRVVVGYDELAIYFACSGCHRAPFPHYFPGNLALAQELFLGQWPGWYLALG